MFEEELRLARAAAEEAGNILRQTEARVLQEQGKDIKLNLDIRSEEAILAMLKPSGYAVLSEEKGLLSGNGSDYTWIVDPLDGTANYWKGMQELCCVSIGLWKNGAPVLGVVNRFLLQEVYIGVVGQGAWKNGVALMPSGIVKVDQAVLATGLPLFRDYSDDGLNAFIKNMQRFKKIRMLGSAALMGCFVAEGKVDAYMEDEIMLWDVAASAAIVKAAGGTVEIQPTENHQCVCKFFANQDLQESYHADRV